MGARVSKDVDLRLGWRLASTTVAQDSPKRFLTKRDTVAVFPTPRNPRTASLRCSFVVGTPLATAEDALERDMSLLLDIDCQGSDPSGSDRGVRSINGCWH